jgi:hypothetical protein
LQTEVLIQFSFARTPVHRPFWPIRDGLGTSSSRNTYPIFRFEKRGCPNEK